MTSIGNTTSRSLDINTCPPQMRVQDDVLEGADPFFSLAQSLRTHDEALQ